MTRALQFWLVQCASWGLFALFNLTLRGYFQHFSLGELVNSLTLMASLLLSSSLLRLYYRRFLSPATPRMVLQMVLAPLVGTLLSAGILAVVLLPNQQRLFGQVSDHATLQLVYSMPTLYILLFGWTIIYVMIKRQRALKEAQLQQLQLIKSLQHSQMDILLNQLSPHFVFNVINNIRALILEDTTKARDCLADLSGVLRVTMQVKQDKVWPLAEEVALVKSYVALNALQYEKRLQVTWQLEPTLMTLQMPCMLLQLMVENAIKHGISRLTQGGEIVIKARQDHASLMLKVTNPGQLHFDQPVTGIGITNIRQRLQFLYGDSAHFNLQQQGKNVEATAVIAMEALCSTP